MRDPFIRCISLLLYLQLVQFLSFFGLKCKHLETFTSVSPVVVWPDIDIFQVDYFYSYVGPDLLKLKKNDVNGKTLSA